MDDPCDNRWEGIVCSTQNETVLNISLAHRNVTGELPNDFFFDLETLERLDFYNNSISGSIPRSLSILSDLTYIHFSLNFLGGTIPDIFGNLTKLQRLSISSNRLDGTIPESIFDLTNLEHLSFALNQQLGGTISEGIGNLLNLQRIYLHYNDFNGTLPQRLFGLHNLTKLYLYHNNFNGSISDGIGNLTNLDLLMLNQNLFSGEIPKTIRNLKNLQRLILYENILTGEIPDIVDLQKLEHLYLNSNRLRGKIPDGIGKLVNLKILALSTNFLEGEIPITFGNLTNLTLLGLANNSLTSSIPIELMSLPELQEVYVHNNTLSGTLPPLIAPKLKNFDARSNVFTGLLPSAFFVLPLLKLLSVSDNCLSTDLSHITECNASNIESLMLVGIGQSSRCKDQSKGLFRVHHTIPKCIWRIESLREVYLAGNGLRGSLESLNLPNISKLFLNNNLIGGELPSLINISTATVVDISNNRISGRLNLDVAEFENQSMYNADFNRLSGPLNKPLFEEFDKAAVLKGNIMSCSSLPANDEYIDTYICETLELQIAVITWAVCAFSFFMVILYIRFKPCSSMLFEDILYFIWLDRVFNDEETKTIPKCCQFMVALSRLVKFAFWLSVVLVVSMIVIYSGFKLGSYSDKFKTHSDQYLYLISGVLLKDEAPACTLLIVFLVLSGFIVYIFSRLFVTEWITISNRVTTLRYEADEGISDPDVTRPKFVLNIVLSLCFLGLSFLANYLYILKAAETDRITLFMLQMCLTIFNSLYRDICIPILIGYIIPSKYGHTATSTCMYAIILVFVDIINPVFATVFIDPLCLYHLYGYDEVITTYSREYCEIPSTISHNCYLYGSFTESFTINSPYIYSNQCRTAMFRKFIPTILLSCAFTTFVSPFFYFLTTLKITKLTDNFVFLGLKLSNRTLILHDVTYWFMFICEDFILLLMYGIVSPFCAVALFCNIASRSKLLRECIYRYYRLQFGDVSESVRRDKYHIEVMCETAQRFVYVYLWPGLSVTPLVFGLYLVEMIADSDDDPNLSPSSLVVAMSFLAVITFSTVPMQCSFQFLRKRRVRECEVRVSHLDRVKESKRISKTALAPEADNQKSYGAEMSVDANAVVTPAGVQNPIHGEIELGVV